MSHDELFSDDLRTSHWLSSENQAAMQLETPGFSSSLISFTKNTEYYIPLFQFYMQPMTKEVAS